MCNYKISEVLNNAVIRDKFISDYFLWGKNVTQKGIGFDTQTCMTFDGCNLDFGSGISSIKRSHSFNVYYTFFK